MKRTIAFWWTILDIDDRMYFAIKTTEFNNKEKLKINQDSIMGYYVGNGIYDFLMKHQSRENFFWTSGNMWMLVYGNEDNEPKVLTVASGKKLDVKISDEEKKAVYAAKQLVEGTNIPVNFVRFDPNTEIDKVGYWEVGMPQIPIISSDNLRNYFMRYGLRMNDVRAQKYINDRSSSPYHDWQRTHMGNSVVVADIDLLRFEDNTPVEIIELKRSIIDINKWEPYKDDYKNFILLSKFACKRNLAFYIVYNRRTKNPFYDDVSKLKIFEFDHRRESYCRLRGCKTILEFAANKQEVN